ncbi:MAG: hypothetical protein RIK87_19400 [Fuerstiella sp.]
MPASAVQPPTTTTACFRADWYALATGARALQGAAVGALLSHTNRLAAITGDLAWVWPVLITAALACGMGCGTAIDRQWQLRFESRRAPAFTLLILAAGMALIGVTAELLFFAALLIGAGTGTDWSSTADAARNSLPANRRWNGMRWWSAAFPGGLAVGVLVNLVPGLLPLLILAAVGLCVGFAVLPALSDTNSSRSMTQGNSTAAGSESGEGRPAVSEAPAQGSVDRTETFRGETPSAGSAGSEADTDAAERLQNIPPDSHGTSTDEAEPECEAAECCGGSSRAFQPAAFSVGVGLAVVGNFVLLGPVFALWQITIDAGSAGGMLSIPIGLAVGFFLMSTAAPNAGYAVSLLPFLVLSIPAVLVAAAVSPLAAWATAVYFPAALLAGGVIQGATSLTGEQFFDCPTDSQRTRLLSMSLFVTALLVLSFGFLRYWWSSAAMVTMAECVVFLLGIALVRAIPAPVISSLGKEGTDEETDAELQDVMAAIKS